MKHGDVKLIGVSVPETFLGREHFGGTARGHFGYETVNYGNFQNIFALLLSFFKLIHLLFFQIKNKK